GRARERIAASLHAHAHGTGARVAAPSAPPSVSAVSAPAAPTVAPSDAEPVGFIGPPAPTPSASASVEPRVPRGVVTVVCRAAGDEVRDGARRLGPSPVFKRALIVGTHHLTLVTTDPRVSRRVDVEVTEDEVASVQEEMTP